MDKFELPLKPCPYCGKIPEHHYEGGSHGYYEAKHRVACYCGLSTKTVHTDNYQEGIERTANEWNNKPPAITNRDAPND